MSCLLETHLTFPNLSNLKNLISVIALITASTKRTKSNPIINDPTITEKEERLYTYQKRRNSF